MTNTDTSIDWRQLREARGLKRPEVATVTGFTVAQVARIEARGTKDNEELRRMAEFFRVDAGVDGEPVMPTREPLPDAVITNADGSVVTKDWHGLRPGDLIKYENDPGQSYEFIHHFKDAKQEYVKIKGTSKKVRGKLRYVVPERVILLNGLKAVDVEPATHGTTIQPGTEVEV